MAHPVEEFEQYRDELLAMLGDRNPIDVLRKSVDDVASMLKGAAPDSLSTPPAPGEWSAQQTLQHLADTDLVYGVRIRMMLTIERPSILGYDQDAFIERFGGLGEDPMETYQRWRSLRLSNLLVYESLSEAELGRVGVHTERGEESVGLSIRLLAGHDLNHLSQFRRALIPSGHG